MTEPAATEPPASHPSGDERVAVALFGGAVAALVGAGLWTVLVKLTEREIGWVAWGVGALVGFAMARLTPSRGATLGLYAAALAALGLATGKVLTVKVVLAPMAEEQLLDDAEVQTQAFAWDMRQRETYSPTVNERLARLGGDTVPDALWEEMLREANARMNSAPPAERERVTRAFLREMLHSQSFIDQLGATLSLFDLLWFFLAIATAWKLMRGT